MKIEQLLQDNATSFEYTLVRGLRGRLAQYARDHLTIPESKRGAHFWMWGVGKNIPVDQILSDFDQDFEYNYASVDPDDPGVLIKQQLTVPVENNDLVFPKNYGIVGDRSVTADDFGQQIPVDNSQTGFARNHYIVSKGPINNYQVVKDYKD